MFHLARNKFDKSLQSKKRKFIYDKIDNIEKANTNNPREFWSHIANLGPQKNRKIPETVEINRILYSDQNMVLTERGTRFEKLYQKPESAKQWYDKTFYETCIA